MALTRKALKAMNLTDEQVDSIIEMHTDTVDGLKEEIKTNKAAADKLAAVQKELDELKNAEPDDYKEKYEAEKRDHDALKAKIATDAARDAKEKAVRAYYESKNIKGKNLTIAMRGTKVDDFELDGDKLKDTKALDDLIAGDYAALVATTNSEGGDDGNPAGGGGNGVDYDKMTDAEYYAAIMKKGK